MSLLTSRVLGEWKEDAETIFMAITESTIVKYRTKRENEVRFFISSVSSDTPDIAKTGYRAIRSHFGIENSLHLVLDMDYGQDLAQMKTKDFIKNRLVLNKLSEYSQNCKEETSKRSCSCICRKSRKDSWL